MLALPPAAASLDGAPNVTLSALKPVGNPLAAGLPGTPSRAAREVTVRLRETDGLPATARLRLAAGIEAAWRADLLEERYGADLPPAGETGAADTIEVAGGMALVPLLPFETVTLRVRLAEPGAAAETTGPAVTAQAPPEPAQPVFTRYWLHGKGPAPAGNVPVAVHFSPTRVTLGGAGGPAGGAGDGPAGSGAGGEADGARLTLTVACGPGGPAARSSSSCPTGSPPRSPGYRTCAPRSAMTWSRTGSRPGTWR